MARISKKGKLVLMGILLILCWLVHDGQAEKTLTCKIHNILVRKVSLENPCLTDSFVAGLGSLVRLWLNHGFQDCNIPSLLTRWFSFKQIGYHASALDMVIFISSKVDGAPHFCDVSFNTKCAEVVPNLKEKELLELDGKNLQIRQVGVNGDPPDPILISWSPMSGLRLIEPIPLESYDVLWFRTLLPWLESPSKVGQTPSGCRDRLLGLNGITKLPGNLLDCLKCAEVMPNLKEKELLELDGKNLQIRQVGVNGDPPDPILISWSPMSGLRLIEPIPLESYDELWFRTLLPWLESPSKVGYSQMDGLKNL
ncbi:hypothetical protein F2Q69_00059752 [Brassica cretica]|uniref:Uncharacterized protein n=1 Tax=Brassica cretica TaxID=69181 RepID=A0A8S9RG52_BRACR|nr:hypothetical protein F2Q69_00059752 [Brassica cretica]